MMLMLGIARVFFALMQTEKNVAIQLHFAMSMNLQKDMS
jgi:hypothetical protein